MSRKLLQDDQGERKKLSAFISDLCKKREASISVMQYCDDVIRCYLQRMKWQIENCQGSLTYLTEVLTITMYKIFLRVILDDWPQCPHHTSKYGICPVMCVYKGFHKRCFYVCTCQHGVTPTLGFLQICLSDLSKFSYTTKQVIHEWVRYIEEESAANIANKCKNNNKPSAHAKMNLIYKVLPALCLLE